MPLIVLRLIFFLVAAGLAVSLVQTPSMPDKPEWLPWVVFFGILGISGIVVALDVVVRKKPLDVISSVYFGLIVGLFLTYVVGLALTPVMPREEWVKSVVGLVIGLVICYTCISLLM